MSIIDLRLKLAACLKNGIDGINPEAGLSVEEIADMFEYPPDDKMGDLALPCFKFAKTLRKAPPMIANELSASLKDAEGIAEVQVAGGYLNIFISRFWWCITAI